MEQPEKVKISSDFVLTKLLMIGILGVLFLLLTDYKRTETNILIEYVITFVVLALLLYYLFTRPNIYYDNKNLYIIKGTTLNTKIPFEDIQSIKFSVIGFGQGSNSYKIKYQDTNKQGKSIRIFTSFFANPVPKFMRCVQKRNPNVIITNGSFGINEFFD